MPILAVIQKQRREFCTVAQLAKWTSEQPQVWYRRVREGAIPHYKIGGSVRVLISDFEDYLSRAKRVGGKSPTSSQR
jgi:hypothetical protein